MEFEINLENLVKMKRVFEEADEDGSGELDPGEFYEKLGPYLGQGLTQTQVAQLFMRIDADCGGTIDWQEFIDFFFLSRGASSIAEGGADWRLHPQDLWRKEWRGVAHKEAAERVYCLPAAAASGAQALEAPYVTGGRGGQLRVWAGADLAPMQSLTNGAGWVTDCAFVECPAWRKLVVGAQDRTLTFYDPVRSTFEYSGRYTCPGAMGPPLCLAELAREEGAGPGGLPGPPRLVWGDTEGAVMLLRAEPPLLRTERQLAPRRDFEVLHAAHSDWVTRLQHIPDVGLVSSSLDATLCMLDLERRKLAATVCLHRKGVRTFGYSPAYSLVASGGVERSVLLWQPKGNTNRKVGELAGHSAGVSHLVVADEQSQVITLSDDHVVRVWDLRNHKCIQAIGKTDWAHPEDAKPAAMAYDASRRRLVCASNKPAVWVHEQVVVERAHDSRLVAALYNATFRVVVSGDEGGTVVMWDLATGRREGGFTLRLAPSAPAPAAAGAGAAARPRRPSKPTAGASAPPPPASHKLTAMAFDAAQRRLLTASDGGALALWNFNSGAQLREFAHREGPREIVAVAFVQQRAPHQEGQQGEAPAGEQSAPGAEGPSSSSASPAAHAPLAAAEAEPSDVGSELSEHALLLQQQQRHCRGASPSADGPGAGPAPGAPSQEAGGEEREAEEEGAANLVLATGWSRALCVWEEGEERRAAKYRRLAGHAADVLCMAPLGAEVAATGDFEGEVRVWHLPSGACLAAFSYGGPRFERSVRKLCWLPADSSIGGAEVLVACGEDGGMQLWRVPLPAVGPQRGSGGGGAEAATSEPAGCTLVARIAAVHRTQDCVTAVCVGPPGGCPQLWTGDSGGHVALWDVSAALAACSGAPAAASAASEAVLPRRLAHWRAAAAPVISLDASMAAGGGQPLLLVGAQDAGVGVWTQRGGLVGAFGRHSWDLGNPATWQDPEAAAAPMPLPLYSGGSGLTPRECIARTQARSASASSRHLGGANGSWLPSARGCIPFAGTPGQLPAGLEGLADALTQVSRLRLRVPEEAEEEGEGRAPLAGAASPSAPAAPAAATSAAAPAPGSQGGAGNAAGGPTLVAQLAAADSAGARLAVLASEAAAKRADRWAVPVHVQAHSALALQRMAPVPAGEAGLLAQFKGVVASADEKAERQERSRSTSPPAGERGRRSSGGPGTIAAILGWREGRGAQPQHAP